MESRDPKILLVDDEESLLRALKRGLGKTFSVDTASCASEALRKLSNDGPYGVIISDMRMPDTDGVELLTQVQELYPDTTRIILTGNNDQETAKRAVNEGCIFRFLTKPCSVEQLRSTINDALARYQLISSEKEVLVTAIEESRIAEQIKKHFLANMSHEIRTPLHGIVAASALMAETQLSEEQVSFLETIQTSSNLLLSIINDILSFSKTEAGKLKLESGCFQLRKALKGLFGILELQAAEQDLELVSFIESDVPDLVIGDQNRLRQILLNLLANAVKYTNEHGGVLLYVGVEKVSSASATLHFAVTDPGPGISAEKCKMIFQPFIQIDNSSTRKFGGMGLGLAICKELVGLMKGAIWVNSKPGIGTAFHFTAEFGIPDDVRATSNAQPEVSSFELSTQDNLGETDSLRVLVAEDNRVNQKLIEKLLTKHGHSVVMVENGKHALEIAVQQTFDLILMDIQMPELDGIEASKRIRAQQAGNSAHVPIVALTAHAFEEDKVRCLAAGMDGFLSKPFNMSELLAVIKASCKRS